VVLRKWRRPHYIPAISVQGYLTPEKRRKWKSARSLKCIFCIVCATISHWFSAKIAFIFSVYDHDSTVSLYPAYLSIVISHFDHIRLRCRTYIDVGHRCRILSKCGTVMIIDGESKAMLAENQCDIVAKAMGRWILKTALSRLFTAMSRCKFLSKVLKNFHNFI